MLYLLPTAFYAAGFLALLLLFYQVVKHFGGRPPAKAGAEFVDRRNPV